MEHSYLEIKSGLGNQLFQYFFAQALYKYTKKKIYYDISFFENSTIDTSLTTRSFLLNEFTTKIRIAPNNDIIAFRRLLDFPLPKPKVLKLLRNRIYVENKFYTPIIFFLSKYFCYYSGYFQTFKYFDFQSNLNIKLKCENKNFLYWKTLIESGDSVGIHMRRGDYANSVNKKIFIQQPQEYFFRALELIKSKNKVKFIYIFTDDINFCKKVNISANAIIVSEDP